MDGDVFEMNVLHLADKHQLHKLPTSLKTPTQWQSADQNSLQICSINSSGTRNLLQIIIVQNFYVKAQEYTVQEGPVLKEHKP